MTSKEILAVATYISETGDTVRGTAEVFKTSKTTVHKNVTQNLKYVDPILYKEVQNVLLKNKAERHIRGGIATREKFRRKKKKKEN